MMRWMYIVCCSLLLVNCQRADNPQDNSWVLTGVLNASDTEHVVRVQRVDGTAVSAENVEVYFWHLNESHPMSPVPESPGYYFIDAATAPLQPLDFAAVRVDADDLVMTGETMLPAPVEIENVSSNVLTVNASSTGAPLLDLSWTAVEGMLYVMTVDTLGVGPHPEIPFTVESGNFNAFFGLPFADTDQTVFDTDFAYYGLHQITIYAIPEAYEEVFLYPGEDFTENINASPDNIQNGSGYLTAVSQTTVAVELMP